MASVVRMSHMPKEAMQTVRWRDAGISVMKTWSNANLQGWDVLLFNVSIKKNSGRVTWCLLKEKARVVIIKAGSRDHLRIVHRRVNKSTHILDLCKWARASEEDERKMPWPHPYIFMGWMNPHTWNSQQKLRTWKINNYSWTCRIIFEGLLLRWRNSWTAKETNKRKFWPWISMKLNAFYYGEN